METQEQVDKYLDNLIEQTEQDIEKVFAKRTKAILASLAKIQQTLDKGGEIKRTDIYNSARYKQELKFIAESVNEEYKEMYKTIQTLLIATYLENYLRSGQLYENEAQVEMGYAIPSAETIRQAVLNPIAELTLSALMNNHRNETIRKINIEISQSLLAGESYSQMAERIQGELGFSAVKSKRVARTEAGRIQIVSRMDSASHAEKYAELTKLWNSQLDRRTRNSHQVLDNDAADKDGYFHFKGLKTKGPHLFYGPGSASQNINCRCTILFLVDNKRPKLRRAKKDEGGSEVIPYVSYEEWKKKLPKS